MWWGMSSQRNRVNSTSLQTVDEMCGLRWIWWFHLYLYRETWLVCQGPLAQVMRSPSNWWFLKKIIARLFPLVIHDLVGSTAWWTDMIVPQDYLILQAPLASSDFGDCVILIGSTWLSCFIILPTKQIHWTALMSWFSTWPRHAGLSNFSYSSKYHMVLHPEQPTEGKLQFKGIEQHTKYIKLKLKWKIKQEHLTQLSSHQDISADKQDIYIPKLYKQFVIIYIYI